MFLLGTDAPDGHQRAGRVGDVRLVPAAIGVWASAAVFLGASSGAAMAGAVVLGIAALGGAGVLVLAPRSPAVQSLVALLLCAATAALACSGRLAAVEESPIAAAARDGGKVHGVAEVTALPRVRASTTPDGSVRFSVAAQTVRVRAEPSGTSGGRVPVVLLGDGSAWGELLPGQQVHFSGPVVPAGGGLVRGLLPVRGPPETAAPPPAAQERAEHVRARIREASVGLPPPADSLLPAFLAGDERGVPAEVTKDFRTAGLTHLVVVSGSHLALLVGAALAAGRFVRAPGLVIALVGAALIGAVLLVAGPGPSILRASVMSGLALLAFALGRGRSGIAGLACAVILLVFAEPELARDYGFALSVLASGAILLAAPAWSDRLAGVLPRLVADTVAVAAVTHVVCLPVLVLLQPEIGWVPVAANAAAAPFVPVAMIGGFAAAVLALVWPAAAAVAAWPPGLAVWAIAGIASVASSVPFGAIPWRGDAVGAAVLAGLIVLFLVLRRSGRAVLAALAAAVAATTCAVPSWPPRDWAVAMCDVGQGDAFALATGPGSAVLVDTGRDREPVDHCLAGLGVTAIPLLVLTHGDADHAGGTEGVLTGRTAERALVPDGFDAADAERALDSGGTAVQATAAGDVWTAGPWTLRVLWPRPSPQGATPEDGNDRSVVLHAQWDPADGDQEPVTVLLTGDVEGPGQRALAAEPLTRGVDVLKTPHHGAATQDPAFLTATRPRAVLTSVGADNTYGHPVPETTEVLDSLTPSHYRTDLHGDVVLLPCPDGPCIAASGPGDPERADR
ncbi:ComEC/Rec2 family competence protein [Nocardiopsis coralliicola]